MTRRNSARRAPVSAPSSSTPLAGHPRASLTLVNPASKPATPRPFPRTPLALWHLLSLDAPSVAAVWTIAVSHAAGLHLPWASAAAMFIAVWMLYAADRLLDARLLDARAPGTSHAPNPDLEARHLFHHRHRRAFLIGVGFSACTLAFLLRTLDPHALRLYTLLATFLAAYLLLIHTRADSAHRLPKELAVGIFFPAAIFIPTIARLPQLRLELLPVALLLAALCSLNCLFLYAWEHPGLRPRAHVTTRWATRRLVSLTASVAALSLLLAVCDAAIPELRHSSIALLACISISSLLLLLLHRLRRRLEPTHLRALADLVLLTPLLLAATAFLRL